MVFAGIYPVVSAEFENLSDAIEKLTLNDASVTVEKKSSDALGLGFRCGFLGLLHMDVFKQRLEQEYGLDVIATAPSVLYKLTMKDGEDIYIERPSDFPEPTKVETIFEPIINATIITPKEYLGNIIHLCEDKRGIQTNLTYMDEQRVILQYKLPLNEVATDFYDQLKSLSSGYASFDYEEADYEPSDLVNILIHLHTDVTALLEHIARVQTERDDVYECAIDALVHGSKEVRVVPYSGTWEAIKYPWHIFTVVKHFLDDASEYISPSAVISEKATIGGKVIIGDNAKIFENAVVKGPVYIGPNSVVGNNSLVRAYSHIGADCVVGFSTEVKGSYLSDGCWSHMSYIGDSILGERCSLGAGTMLANWRFDEKNISVKIKGEMIDSKLDKFGSIIGSDCKTGVNVSVMPGVKVGPGSIIGSHVCLTEDLEPGKMILPESRGIVTRNIYREKESTAEQRMKKLRCVE